MLASCKMMCLVFTVIKSKLCQHSLHSGLCSGLPILPRNCAKDDDVLVMEPGLLPAEQTGAGMLGRESVCQSQSRGSGPKVGEAEAGGCWALAVVAKPQDSTKEKKDKKEKKEKSEKSKKEKKEKKAGKQEKPAAEAIREADKAEAPPTPGRAIKEPESCGLPDYRCRDV